jgi:hypothetical protein
MLQIEFLESELSLVNGPQKLIHFDTKFTDDDVHNLRDNDLVVLDKDGLDISNDSASKLAIWENRPVTKRSAAISSIIRKAASMVGSELDKKATETLGDSIAYSDRDDINVMLYESMTRITNPKIYYKKVNIWDQPWSWIKPGDSIDRRLEYLYLEMSWYTLSITDEWKKAKSTGCSPSKFKWLKTCKFSSYKVSESIKLLSLWKATKACSFQTLIKLGVVWS